MTDNNIQKFENAKEMKILEAERLYKKYLIEPYKNDSSDSTDVSEIKTIKLSNTTNSMLSF